MEDDHLIFNSNRCVISKTCHREFSTLEQDKASIAPNAYVFLFCTSEHPCHDNRNVQAKIAYNASSERVFNHSSIAIYKMVIKD